MRKHTATFFSLLIILPIQFLFGYCQSENDPIFAFVRAETKQGAAEELDWTPALRNHRREIARQVYEDLVEARGDARLPVPEFTLDPEAAFVAWMKPGARTIGLEELAYEVCRSFGADSLNAMAALLAHEVTHYYERHGWIRNFMEEKPALAANKKEDRAEPGLLYEIQADYLGGFLAYSAGYPTFSIMPELLERLYSAYGYPTEESDAYPSLSERRERAELADDKVRDLTDVFNTATLLTIIEAYSDARQYLNYVLDNFQSRELYNNLGVITVLEALSYFNPEEVPLGLPLELDAGSRLQEGGLRAAESYEERVRIRRQLLNEANRYFGQAAGMDEMYPAALINLGCVSYLLGEEEDAAFYARRAARLAELLNRNTALADAWVLEGLIRFEAGKRSEAIQFFEKAAVLNSPVAQVNTATLKETAEAIPAVKRERMGIEKIGGQSLEDIFSNLDVAKQIFLTGNQILGVDRNQASTLYLDYLESPLRYTLFLQSNRGYEGETYRGIQPGDTQSEIEKQYDRPARIVGLAKGRVLVYPVQRILFFMNEENKLDAWVLYQVVEE